MRRGARPKFLPAHGRPGSPLSDIADLGLNIAEALLIPFYRGDTAVGTIWVIAHDRQKRFDAEDLRVMSSLSQFASSAVQTLTNLQAIKVAECDLRDARMRLDSQAAALKEADQRKDEFLALLAHEPRNPLAAISNAATLMTVTNLKEHHDDALGAIQRQTRHLSRLIDDLLDVAGINLGKIALRREVLDAAPVLASAAQTVKSLVDERNHTLGIMNTKRRVAKPVSSLSTTMSIRPGAWQSSSR